jgi:hypothetical protein
MSPMSDRPAGGPLAGVAAGALVVLLAALSSSCGARSTLYDGVYQSSSPHDASGDDAGFDELPPVQTTPLPDVVVSNCTDPGVLYIYLVTLQNELWTFDPKTGALVTVGTLDCPTSSTPFSMAVDRQGTAYVIYSDGELFRVSTRTAACSATAFVPPNPAYDKFGMGFVGDSNGATDTLYIATVAMPSELATLGLQTFVPAPVGELSLESAELTGTVDGRLFAFYSTGSSSAIAELDAKTAGVVSNTNLADLPQNSGWAFGLWGGDFYLFTGSTKDLQSPSLLTRYRPSDGSQTTIMTLPQTVVGAGVSTCASQM